MAKFITDRLPSAVAALILLASGTTGCGWSSCTVKGRVFLQDDPVTGGSVILYCDGNQIARGQIGPDGTYSIPNVPRGAARVAVLQPVRLPEGLGKTYPMPPVINGPISPAAVRSAKGAQTSVIPKRYSIPEESGLTVQVGRAVCEFDIHLTR